MSIAIGSFSRTASIGSVALGTSARAEGFNSFAAMRQSAAIADYSTAIGSTSGQMLQLASPLVLRLQR